MTAQITESTVAEMRQLASRYPHPQSALLPMLHLLQSAEGFVTSDGIEACAAVLGLTAAEVSAVATFYTMYKRRPIGQYHVGVCTNTLCAVMGGDAIFERLSEHLGVGNDETTDDGAIMLEHVECNAACDYAPVVMVNWEFFDNQTPESAVDLVDDLRSGTVVQSTRGARICTWREAERVLAGFPDGRADEGPAAGPATLLGLQIARRNGWQAPEAREVGGRSASDGAGDSRVSAAEETDISRGESEAKLDESPADVVGGKTDAPIDMDEHNGGKEGR
jgi:NADH-quinone oxidoreductase subunit E